MGTRGKGEKWRAEKTKSERVKEKGISPNVAPQKQSQG